ncbi:hypothetical protein BS50DRAFT_583924 [Corynespora cassiicola Philippines]|uniref:Uncharacterized protein n=1 Tax=Corynespora cassiicola Philippines TaxID=1448308 RepID=A0A2T2P3Z5_CORCC|nr:hypothetical protein BS50DRAFT_583924 [Corynespora cassiicola Philippines]
MGSCNSTECDPIDPADFEPNNDIVGSGVLVAFLLSACMTLGGAVYGYLSDSLPAWYLSDMDKAIIDTFASFKNDGILRYLMNQREKNYSNDDNKKFKSPKLDRSQRQEAVTRFVLALSDQQLVTGFAMIIGIATNRCNLAIFEHQFAFALTWCSSTTHLATLDTLQDYFLLHRVLRNWRVLGMIALLGLLIYAFVLQSWLDDPIQKFNAASPFWCPETSVRPSSIWSGFSSRYHYISVVTTAVMLISSYSVKIYRTYNRQHIKFTLLEIFSVRPRLQARNPSLKISSHRYQKILRELRQELFSMRKRTVLERLMNPLEKSRICKKLRKMKELFSWSALIYGNSYLSHSTSVVFMLFYGCSRIATLIKDPGYIRADNELEDIKLWDHEIWDIGQITPLVLLILPIWAASEIYYGKLLRISKGFTNVFAEAIEKKKFASTNVPILSTSQTVTVTPCASSPPTSPTEAVFDNTLKKYNENILEIRKLYYHESRDLDNKCSKATSSIQLREYNVRREILLGRFEQLKATEMCYIRYLKRVLFCMFIISWLLYASSGALLGTQSSYFALAGAGIMVTMIGGKILRFIFEVIESINLANSPYFEQLLQEIPKLVPEDYEDAENTDSLFQVPSF